MSRMSSGLRELRVWQESVGLGGDVIRAVRSGVRRETKAISDAVMLTALSVGSHVADGFARPSAVEQRESYLAAKRALLRLETELAVARQAELVPMGAFTELCARTGQVTRLLTGFLVYLDRQIAEQDAGAARSGVPTAAAIRDSARAHA
jgi:four helix bundle protein